MSVEFSVALVEAASELIGCRPQARRHGGVVTSGEAGVTIQVGPAGALLVQSPSGRCREGQPRNVEAGDNGRVTRGRPRAGARRGS